MSASQGTHQVHAHFPSVDVPTCDRWLSAAVDADGRLWGAVRTEREGRSHLTLLLGQQDHGPMQSADLPTGNAHPQRPALAADARGGVSIAWNQFGGGAWQICFARANENGSVSEVESVWQAESLCSPPSCLVSGDVVWVAWSAREGASFRVMLSQRSKDGTWASPAVLSDGALPAFRPVLAPSGQGVLAVWDQYRDGRYEIAYADLAECTSPGGAQTLSIDGHHWLHPVVVAMEDQQVLAWLDVQDVSDPERGIVEHGVGISTGILRGGRFSHLSAAEDSGPQWAADLRPGLLATTHYEGYDGVRRRPQLAVQDDDTVWLCWEARDEEGRKRSGRLMSRRLGRDGWEPEVLLHDTGLCYAVPPRFSGPQVPTLFIPQDAAGRLAFESAAIRPGDGAVLDTNPQRFAHWRPSAIAVKPEPRRSIELDGERLYLFWADFHCHSVQSPDAEGEPDELLFCGRDVAALDAMAIVDNDYYPNKALSETEWRQQEELVRAFTDLGRFVVFPAYEYTYHGPDLEPDFNHRYVMFRRPPGRLVRRIDDAGCTIDRLESALEAEDALLVAHHCTWEISGRARTNVEVCSSWRVCIEETDWIERRLAAGDRFGFMACSDSHRACPGMGGALTGIYAAALTPDTLFDALCARRTIATQGQRVLIDFRVNDSFLGGECKAQSPPKVSLQVIAPEPIEFVEVIRDRQVVFRAEPGSSETEAGFVDESVTEGTHYYYVRLKLVGDPSLNAPDHPRDFYRPFITEGPYASNLARARGPFAWSSPIWVTVHG